MYIQKWEQKAIFKKFQDNILVENDDFIRLLKVIGNNHKYDLRTQMSIATFRDTSTACADFNFWNNKANRFIRKYEVGIPVFNQDEEITGYIFDGIEILSIHKMSAKLLNKANNNGWDYFYIIEKGNLISLNDLRYRYNKEGDYVYSKMGTKSYF